MPSVVKAQLKIGKQSSMAESGGGGGVAPDYDALYLKANPPMGELDLLNLESLINVEDVNASSRRGGGGGGGSRSAPIVKDLESLINVEDVNARSKRGGGGGGGSRSAPIVKVTSSAHQGGFLGMKKLV